MTQLLYISQIRTALPDIAFDSLEQTGSQNNDVVILNREWIFRFPRTRDGVQRLQAETQLLDALQGRLPLPVPHIAHQRFDPPVPGLAFAGCRRLPGQPLLPDSLAPLRSEFLRDDLASQLAGFLRALHNLPFSELPPEFPGIAPGQPPAEQRSTWETLYAEVRARLFPAMRPDARRELTAHFEAYLDDPALHVFDPCPRHGDFGGSSILWDAEAVRITAVLDFSHCAPGDPAYDLASASAIDADLFERLAPRYAPDPTRRAVLLARARFYRGTFALQEALSGLRHSDSAAYQRGMEGYI